MYGVWGGLWMTELTTFCIILWVWSFETREKSMEHFSQKSKGEPPKIKKRTYDLFFATSFFVNFVFFVT